MRELSVGLDTLATLADLAGPGGPDLTAATTLAELAGAAGVRLGVTEEASGVDASTLANVRRAAGRFELRMAPVPELVKLALEARPDRVLLASEPRGATGRPGPLDWRAWGDALGSVVRSLHDAGMAVSILVPPDPEAVKNAHRVEAVGVELFTGHWVDLPGRERAATLEGLAETAHLAAKLRMRVAAGGGLDLRSIPELLVGVPVVSRVVVGRAFVARSILLGVDRAVRDLREHT